MADVFVRRESASQHTMRDGEGQWERCTVGSTDVVDEGGNYALGSVSSRMLY